MCLLINKMSGSSSNTGIIIGGVALVAAAAAAGGFYYYTHRKTPNPPTPNNGGGGNNTPVVPIEPVTGQWTATGPFTAQGTYSIIRDGYMRYLTVSTMVSSPSGATTNTISGLTLPSMDIPSTVIASPMILFNGGNRFPGFAYITTDGSVVFTSSNGGNFVTSGNYQNGMYGVTIAYQAKTSAN